jgi:hypothetical protein
LWALGLFLFNNSLIFKNADIVSSELVINSTKERVSIALLEDGKLVELNESSLDKKQFSVGDIYLARVKKSCPASMLPLLTWVMRRMLFFIIWIWAHNSVPEQIPGTGHFEERKAHVHQ